MDVHKQVTEEAAHGATWWVPPTHLETSELDMDTEVAAADRSAWGCPGRHVEQVFRASGVCQLTDLGCRFTPCSTCSLPHLEKNPPTNEAQEPSPEAAFSQDQAFLPKTQLVSPTLQRHAEDPPHSVLRCTLQEAFLVDTKAPRLRARSFLGVGTSCLFSPRHPHRGLHS